MPWSRPGTKKPIQTMATPKSEANTQYAEYTLTAEGLQDLKRRLADLYKIAPVARLKLQQDYLLAYSATKTLHSFKGAVMPLQGLMAPKSGVIPDAGLDFIVLNTRNLVQNMNFLAQDKPVTLRLRYGKGAIVANELRLSDAETNLIVIGGDPSEIKSITRAQMEQKMDPASSNFSFTMTGEQLQKVKRMSQLSSAEAVNVWVRDGEVRIGQATWNVRIADADEDESYAINKKYLSCIEPADEITVYAFDSFILVKESATTLMIGRELDDIK